jgi:hypothetical protein
VKEKRKEKRRDSWRKCLSDRKRDGLLSGPESGPHRLLD